MSDDELHPWLRVTRDGPVQTVTLTRADQRNPQTPSLWAALSRAGEQTPDDVRVVVLRGEGPSFSAGLHRDLLRPGGMPGEPDLLSLAAGSGVGLDEAISDFQLALAADLRVVADDARLAMRETSLGLVPDLAGSSPLVQLAGYARALEICATGRFVGAEEAVAIGLASTAVPVAALEATTKDLVDALLAAPEQALRELKALLRNAITATPPEQHVVERQAQARLLKTLAWRQ